jgi:subtilisin family serine protease
VPDPRLADLPVDATQLTDEVLVTQPRGASDATIEAAARRLGLTILERVDSSLLDSRIVRLLIPDGRAVGDIIVALAGESGVGPAQPSFVYRRQEGAGASARTPQYALERIAARAAHSTSTGRGVVVAVIDTGVDATHPDIRGATIASRDLIGATRAPEIAHATAIAGIITADGVTHGVAPGVRVLSVRAFATFSSRGPARTARSTSLVLLKAIDQAMAEKSRILNLSFAGPRDPLIERAIAIAIGRAAVAVAAAGNGGPDAAPAYPAAYPGVIAVTATDAADRLYRDANRGDYVTVAAPGVEVLAASADHGHELVSGTSFATAHVSGLAALLLEVAPHLGASEVALALRETARDLGAPGQDAAFGAGLVDARALLAHRLAGRASR